MRRMSMFMLRIRIFFLPRIIIPVIVLGVIFWWVVDGYVEGLARGIIFTDAWKPFEVVVQDLILRRGARAIWLWTFLPASIGWMMAGKAVKRFDKISYGR